MKYLAIVAVAFGLAACDEANTVGQTNSGDFQFQEICVDNVVYLTRYLMHNNAVMTVKFNTDSKIETCKGNQNANVHP